MKRWLKRIAVTLLVIAAGAAGSAWWALRQTRQVPEFYTQAQLQLPQDVPAASAMLETEVVELQDAASQLGSWEARFSEGQINAWLVHQLPKEFSQMLPPGVEDPRIAIEDGRILAAARYKHGRIDTIVSFEVKLALTEQANVLAVRIENLRAGSLPLPLKSFLTGISREASKGNLEVVWDMDDAGPVALVTIPSDHPGYARSPVVVEAVTLQDGVVQLAGHTGPQAWNVYRPRTTVYQLASARVGRKTPFQSLPGSRSMSGTRSYSGAAGGAVR